jgi:hypothetical protein
LREGDLERIASHAPDLIGFPGLSNADGAAFRTALACTAVDEPEGAAPGLDALQSCTATKPPERRNRYASSVVVSVSDRRSKMFRGALLWLIGIPLPIILILFFLGYLS